MTNKSDVPVEDYDSSEDLSESAHEESKNEFKLEKPKLHGSIWKVLPKRFTAADMFSTWPHPESYSRTRSWSKLHQDDSIPAHVLEEKKRKRRIEKKKKQKEESQNWFAIKVPEVTQEVKEDLRLLQLRNFFDPKRFYKANDRRSLPDKFQIGTVLAGAADNRASRLTRSERKGRFADELLSDRDVTKYTKRVFEEIQDIKQAGGKQDYGKRRKRLQRKKNRREQ